MNKHELKRVDVEQLRPWMRDDNIVVGVLNRISKEIEIVLDISPDAEHGIVLHASTKDGKWQNNVVVRPGDTLTVLAGSSVVVDDLTEEE